MNKYDYLAGTHDLLSLTDWGPFARDLYALSHIADRKRGIKFDFCFVPGLHHRAFFPPETLRECGCSPMESAPDLSCFMVRQQMESQKLDLFYADSAYADIGKDLWLGRCEFVNNSREMRAASLLILSRLAPRPDVAPCLPEGARFIDALEYETLTYAYERFDHHLVNCGGRRGEQNYPGTVNNRCLGQPAYNHPLPCFAAVKGDQVTYKMKLSAQDQVLCGRLRVEEGKTQRILLTVNGKSRELTLKGTGAFDCVELYRGKLAEETHILLESLEDSCGLRLDGFVAGPAALTVEQIRFAPVGQAVSPRVTPGSIPRSSLIEGQGLDCGYCVWYDTPAASERDYQVENFSAFCNYFYGLRQPYFRQGVPAGNEHCHDAYILPIEISPGERRAVYTLYCAAASPAEAEKRIISLDKSPSHLEQLFEEARKKTCIPAGTPAGKAYEFSQQLMAAAALTNINFPISKQGNNLRHHVPDKYFNSLYSWDSGFIGLGFLELDKIRAIENLNVYVTDPGDENKFLLYGTPVPVQAYLYAEIWNRFQDQEMLAFFYPRLLQFYQFIAGHVRSSSYRKNKSGLLAGWDYFYNSGGWDDYPPQWHLVRHRDEKINVTPVVTTAHAIRFAKFLRQAAQELGMKEDQKLFEKDIAFFSSALQKYSWSGKDEIFSYVEHDENGEPLRFFTDPASGENFNFGMDGISPLFAGICTPQQREALWARLSDPARMWSDTGISTVDKSAPYFRHDGYWNGCVWMPYQWFFWKAALDSGRSDIAGKIAQTALKVWANEVDQSRYCFEHFYINSGRGAGCCHFGGLSSPVLNWYGACFTPGRFTAGFDTWIKAQHTEADLAWADLVIDGEKDDSCTLLYVAGEGRWQASYNGTAVPCRSGIEGCLEITLPKAGQGKLVISRV